MHPSTNRSTAALQSVAQAVSQFLTAHQGLLRSLLPESREAALRALARLHLMLFFFNGRCDLALVWPADCLSLSTE